MDFGRNLSVDKKFAFNISFIMLLGLFLSACSNLISINDTVGFNSNQPEVSISDISEILDPILQNSSGEIDVDTLIKALESDGYTQNDILTALDTLIRDLENSSGIDSGCLKFKDLMSILKPSQDELNQGKEIRDTNSGLIEKILCGDFTSSNSFDPDMELSSKYLICPTIPNTAPVIPLEPYDEELGDCALRGKSAEIETWLTELELIAASCQANRDTNWATTLAARDYLDANIDELEDLVTVITPTGEIDEGWFDGPVQTRRRNREIEPIDHSLDEDESSDTPLLYTNRLMRIGENVEEYCTMVDEIIEPLWQACNEINFYQDQQVPDPEEYHSILELGMDDAQTSYDLTDTFYINNLQSGGWDDFRSSFNASSLDCPLDSQAPDTKFTFSQNAFCRKGSSSAYEEVATFLEGQEVQIVGRNHHEPRWWVIPNPGARGQCWVSDSTGAAEGPVEELVIVAPPPLVINKPSNDQSTTKTCSKDLGPNDCKAAGGTMGGAVAQECICP